MVDISTSRNSLFSWTVFPFSSIYFSLYVHMSSLQVSDHRITGRQLCHEMQRQSCASSFARNSEVEVLGFSLSVLAYKYIFLRQIFIRWCIHGISLPVRRGYIADFHVRPKNKSGELNDLFPEGSLLITVFFSLVCSHPSYLHIWFPCCDRQKFYLLYKATSRDPLSSQGRLLYQCLRRSEPSFK